MAHLTVFSGSMPSSALAATASASFSDGKFKGHDVVPLKKQGKSTFLELTLTEGQNREIRRLMARVGHKVLKLQRVKFGPIRLGRLKKGEYRELTRDEITRLEEMVERNTAEGREAKPDQG